MKKSEAIIKYRRNLEDVLPALYHSVIDSDGRILYSVYLWEDGEIEALEDVQGGNTSLKPKDMEPRELFYITTVSMPCFDPWNYSDHAAPDDPAERDAERKEIVEWLLDEYSRNLLDLLDSILADAEQEEEYETLANGANE